MPLLLPGQAPRADGRRGQDDLLRLRLISARRAAIAAAGGLLLYAGHPPLDQAWAGVAAVAALLLLARDVSSARRPMAAGFGWGLVAGAVFFGALLTWIARFGLVPWALLSLILALFIAAFVAGMSAWSARPWRPAAAVVLWVALEALRTAGPLGGFPWGVLGYTQHTGGPLLPVARTLGVLGVSAAVAALGALAAEAWDRALGTRGAGPARGAPGPALPAAIAAPALGIAAVLAGSVALGAVAPPAGSGRTIDIAAVQGNAEELPPLFAQREDQQRIERMGRRMLDATRPLAEDPPALTVWPESSLDADVRRDPALQELVNEAVGLLDGRPLIAGQLLDGPTDGTLRNAMVLFDADGEIASTYLKRKLVPFGEYVPLRSWLDWYPTLAHIPRDQVPGDQAGVFDIAGALVGPVTCYESVFPGVVRDQVRAGAQILVVSTNNAAYGRTPASAQHVAFSRLRAVESGRWVLHAGISGISGVVDPHGRVTQRTELFERAIVRADLPLVDGHTPATRIGPAVEWLALTLALGGIVWMAIDRRRVRGFGEPDDREPDSLKNTESRYAAEAPAADAGPAPVI